VGAPSGEYAVITIPFSFAYARREASGRHGCSSTWFVTGTVFTRGSAASLRRSGTPKFETPSAFTFPVPSVSNRRANTRGKHARVEKLLHCEPGVHDRWRLVRPTRLARPAVDVRLWPVHQVQVNIIDPESLD
jgi:hypothetical protein